MRKSFLVFCLFLTSCAWAQSVIQMAQQFHQKPDDDGIFYVGPEVSAPRLLSAAPAPYPSGKMHEGMSVFAMVIDARGIPQHIELLHSNGDVYDRLALASLKSARFAAGVLSGKPVPVWVDCRLVFRSDRSPVYPEVLITERDLPPPDVSRLADFNDPFVRHPYVQVALVTVLVGVDGKPQAVRVVRGLGFGLDKKAADAVWHYRFLPATSKGKPVPARRNVEVNFSVF
jgi:hypothetical protein